LGLDGCCYYSSVLGLYELEIVVSAVVDVSSGVDAGDGDAVAGWSPSWNP
jgi:hypothetical protein